jgi:hypothetical protein
MDLDIPVDPNEPTYCFCNQVSYGEMVACDNPDVCFYFYVFLYLYDYYIHFIYNSIHILMLSINYSAK